MPGALPTTYINPFLYTKEPNVGPWPPASTQIPPNVGTWPPSSTLNAPTVPPIPAWTQTPPTVSPISQSLLNPPKITPISQASQVEPGSSPFNSEPNHMVSGSFAAGQKPVIPNASQLTAMGGNPTEVQNLNKIMPVTGQMPTSLFAYYGGDDEHDPVQQAQSALNYYRDNAQTARSILNREPTPTDMMIMQSQGNAGIGLLGSNPSTNAIKAISPYYMNDPEGANRAILSNGGTPDMTVGDFIKLQESKLPTKNINLPQNLTLPGQGTIVDQILQKIENVQNKFMRKGNK